jgi:hypothetical protein
LNRNGHPFHPPPDRRVHLQLGTLRWAGLLLEVPRQGDGLGPEALEANGLELAHEAIRDAHPVEDHR